MSFPILIRRIHLYLGLFLLPWFFLYGVSSIPFSHNTFFQQRYGAAEWSVRFDRAYELDIAPEASPRQVGERILQDAGLTGAFGANRAGDGRWNVYRHDFWSATRVTYFPDRKRLLAEDRGFRWDHFLTGWHARGGFDQDSVLEDAWGVAVDLVQIGILLWIATGVYMWWQIRQLRGWGALALGGGVLSFAVFLLAL